MAELRKDVPPPGRSEPPTRDFMRAAYDLPPSYDQIQGEGAFTRNTTNIEENTGNGGYSHQPIRNRSSKWKRLLTKIKDRILCRQGQNPETPSDRSQYTARHHFPRTTIYQSFVGVSDYTIGNVTLEGMDSSGPPGDIHQSIVINGGGSVGDITLRGNRSRSSAPDRADFGNS